jgi:hypothetical protein
MWKDEMEEVEGVLMRTKRQTDKIKQSEPQTPNRKRPKEERPNQVSWA